MATYPRLNTQKVEEEIRRMAKDTIFNLIDPASPKSLEAARYAIAQRLLDAMHGLKKTHAIDDYSVEVEAPPGPLAERRIPKERKPGDRWGRRGLVISSDGAGKGVVLDPDCVADPSALQVRVSMRLPYAIDSIVIEFQAVDTAY